MEDIAYLDTHVVVWLYSGELDLFSKKVQEILNKSKLLISPIVKLELQYLYEIKRIKINSKKVISTLESEIGLMICNHDFNSIVGNAIKANWTRDPFDRIICSQAKINNSTLITKDKSILKNYKNGVW